ncbi:MAG TPA: flagellar biosynthesis protein FlgE [Aeromonadales bacterium]|nr:flagellar biosynthesis protein FlgE [Aeromonadales bacterium]
MAVSGTSSSGFQAFQSAQQRVADAADRIAKNGTTENSSLNDLASAVVDLKQGELQAQAAAKVIETENKTIGSLLDIKA